MSDENEDDEPEEFATDGCGGCFREPYNKNPDGSLRPHSDYCLKRQETQRCKAWSAVLAGRCDYVVDHEGMHSSAGDGFYSPSQHSER